MKYHSALLMLLSTIATIMQANQIPTVAEELLLNSYSAPQFLSENLDRFFEENQELRDMLLKRSRLVRNPDRPGGKKPSNEAIQKHHTDMKNIGALLEKSSIENTGVSTLVLASEKYFPGYLLKVPIFTWPSPHQNTSRVWLNAIIERFTQENKLTCIVPVQKWLYHIPDRPKSPINDDNYLVVVKKQHTPQRTTRESKHAFAQLVTFKQFRNGGPFFALAANDRAFELLTEMLQVITGTGVVWSVVNNADTKGTNCSFVASEQNLRATFLETEQPGYPNWSAVPPYLGVYDFDSAADRATFHDIVTMGTDNFATLFKPALRTHEAGAARDAGSSSAKNTSDSASSSASH